jgi:hypothetical protein
MVIFLIKASLYKAGHNIDIGGYTLCISEPTGNKCHYFERIYIPNKILRCTSDLLFQFNHINNAYLSAEGKFSQKSERFEVCRTDYRNYSYLFNDKIIEIIKHKNFIYVTKVKNRTSEKKDIISDFIQNNILNEIIQYVGIASVILINILIYYLKKCNFKLR